VVASKPLRHGAFVVLCIAAPLTSAQAAAAIDDDCFIPANSHTLHAVPAGAPTDARGVWTDSRRLLWPGHDAAGRYRLYYSAKGDIVATVGTRVRGADGARTLTASDEKASARFGYLGAGALLSLAEADAKRVESFLRGQAVLVQEGKDGKVIDATGTQIAAALDDRFAAARQVPELGATVSGGNTAFKLWAPTAQAAYACVQPGDQRGSGGGLLKLKRDDATGVWSGAKEGDLSGYYYTYLVDVFMPGTGLVRERVTDPYSVSLGANSERSYIARLDAPSLTPEDWNEPAPQTVAAATDQVVYELQVRDFSANDASVPAEERGKFLAFTHADSAGMRHLRALAQAGLTDVHLLPVFDFYGIPELGCVAPTGLTGAADSDAQQKIVSDNAAKDCFNWGYAPMHFGAPEGSYSSNPADGATRILELRKAVQALHRAGLRVGFDVVYNHTQAAGQSEFATLDRIVPGYYHRLDAKGAVEISTCCQNTATENAMMARLMIDTAVRWVRDYRIDSFRFDLMGHQPRAAMEELQIAVDQAAGRHINILGEGWNFGEVKDGARFVQASQLSLDGSHLASLSDRARDAVRGGGASDEGAALVERQGFINGLGYAPNASTRGRDDAAALRHANELVRAGLAGTLRDYTLRNADGKDVPLAQIDYSGQPAGYAAEPDETVNYTENHDDPTLYDISALRLPADTSREERARVQMLGVAIVAFSQGIAYFHAGHDILRSKSLDRSSNESGDWFNALDWSYQDNGFGHGLPPAVSNAKSWDVMRPVLANANAKPAPEQIAWSRDAFRDLLRIRASSGLFRLRSTAEIQKRLRFVDTGKDFTVIGAHIDGKNSADAHFDEVLYFINVDVKPHTLTLPEERGKKYALHPVQRNRTAIDTRPQKQAKYAAKKGVFTLPPRSAVVYVVESP
jgi:pullulanase